MADPLIDVSDLETRLGYDVEAGQAEALIDDASALVREIAGWDDTEPDVVPAAVVPVVVNMVRRGLDNPHGHESEQVGNYRYSGAKTEGIFATRREAWVIRKSAGKLGVGTVELEGYMPVGADHDAVVSFSGESTDTSWLEGSL